MRDSHSISIVRLLVVHRFSALPSVKFRPEAGRWSIDSSVETGLNFEKQALCVLMAT